MADSPAIKGQMNDDFSANRADTVVNKILVVDDNDALRYSLSRLLTEAGYNIVEARNGHEALERANEGPDLITLDVNLPDIDGFQVCRTLKNTPSTAHIPILHVSSTFVDTESKVHGLREGADGYIAEPIDRAELVATVAALLRLKNAESQARRQAEIAEASRRELALLNETLEERIKERTEELRAANEGLRELSARLLKMRDEEQRRIARELHDSIGQLLAAIRMNNASIMRRAGPLLDASLSKVITDNDSMLQEVLESIRTISHLLHPPLLDEAGLRVALQWYVEEFSKRSGISVKLGCPSTLARLGTDLETAVFRIVQECLGNVHRHSGSRTASVDLQIHEANVVLSIQDSGVGIPAARQQEMRNSGGRIGVGLRGIRERVSQFGGDLRIDSTSSGTTVTAFLPFAGAHSSANPAATI